VEVTVFSNILGGNRNQRVHTQDIGRVLNKGCTNIPKI